MWNLIKNTVLYTLIFVLSAITLIQNSQIESMKEARVEAVNSIIANISRVYDCEARNIKLTNELEIRNQKLTNDFEKTLQDLRAQHVNTEVNLNTMKEKLVNTETKLAQTETVLANTIDGRAVLAAEKVGDFANTLLGKVKGLF